MKGDGYTLLFADDEYWIRENFRACCDWIALRVELLECAVDGEDALRKVRDLEPDILVTDINMPFLGGIDLIKKVVAVRPETSILVLSGYDDFAYVHDALIAGAGEYLLKPLDPGKIAEIIEKTVSALDTRKRVSAERKLLDKKITEAEKLLSDRRLSAYLPPDGKRKMPAPGGTRHAHDAPLERNMCLVLIKSACQESAVRTAVEDIFRDGASHAFGNTHSSGEFIVLTAESPSRRDALCNEIISRLFRDHGKKIRIGTSSRFDSLDGMGSAYAEALSAIRCKALSDGNFRVSADDPGLTARVTALSPGAVNETVLSLQTRDRRRIDEVIRNRLGFTGENIRRWSWYQLKETLDRLIGIIMQNCDFDDTAANGRIEMEILSDMARLSLEAETPESIIDAVDDLISGFLDSHPWVPGEDSMKTLIRFVSKHLDDHYHENLSLSSLGNAFHVDPSYLSRVFKQETGTSPVHYLTALRVDKAKDFMRDSRLSLAQISSLVGYEDYVYFSRVFKKETGMNPSEYRDAAKIAPGAP